MADKKPFVLRISAETMKKMEKWAADEFRSVNGQIEWLLSKCLREAGRMKSEESEEREGEGKGKFLLIKY